MMNSYTLIFPHQLFRHHPALFMDRPVCLIEEFLYFRQFRFHQQKIMFHRASMKAYAHDLNSQGYQVFYIESSDSRSDVRNLIREFSSKGPVHFYYCDTVDDWLEKRIHQSADENACILTKLDSPNFLNTEGELIGYFLTNRYFQTEFYIHQRKKRGLLLEAPGKPQGGKWTFDSENRKKMPANHQTPAIQWPEENKFIEEAGEYTRVHFKHHYGNTGHFRYPVTHQDADHWLRDFLDNRFTHFGMYEDAMIQQESILYHSLLSPLINTGLLDPNDVIDKIIQHVNQYAIPLNSTEGLIRQLIGWREFIRGIYILEGRKQRTRNYWGFSRKIPHSFWTGSTGIHPIDTVIQRVLKTGYCHHIERLMVLGNFMLLCEFDPDEVYRWFMEMFIDSYDWVMVPNVYGMTQFADGGTMTTKPYISGSNYLLKMGDWNKGPWQEIWDGLFWRFMHIHRDFFAGNPRLGMLLKTFDKMSPEKRNTHLQTADRFLAALDK